MEYGRPGFNGVNHGRARQEMRRRAAIKDVALA